MRLGFIGLGNHGAHLAGSLLREGFAVTVHDLHEDAVGRLLEAGAVWAGSARDAAAASDAVITCLPSPEAVTATVEGENGILAGMKPGGAWIDTSTNDLHELQRLAALAAEQGAPSCRTVRRTRSGVRRGAPSSTSPASASRIFSTSTNVAAPGRTRPPPPPCARPAVSAAGEAGAGARSQARVRVAPTSRPATSSALTPRRAAISCIRPCGPPLRRRPSTADRR